MNYLILQDTSYVSLFSRLQKNFSFYCSSQLSTQTGSNPNTVAGSTSPDLPTYAQDEEFPECDWSEHYCPDGHKYYYNCVTLESRVMFEPS